MTARRAEAIGLEQLLAARNAEEAIGVLRANTDLDVVLIDVALPAASGPALYEEIKRVHEPLAERVVFVSGGLVDAEVGRFLESVTNPVIAKPIDPSSLADLIATLIR